MAEVFLRRRLRWVVGAVGVAVFLAAAAAVFWDDLQRNALDPKIPYQTYKPPKPPDYSQRAAWRLLPADPAHLAPGAPPTDVFFLSPTTYDGGEQWNAPIDDRKGARLFRTTTAPNYAGPFERVGRIFAPGYRQASLYSLLTLRDDAREARQFAYGDVKQAFEAFLGMSPERPFILVGVEQGGTLATRLLAEEIAPNARLRARLVAAYLQETIVPADAPPIPPCATKGETGCLAAWMSVDDGAPPGRGPAILDRALVWSGTGELVGLNGKAPLCFNPLMGAETEALAPPRLNLGAANATGLEPEARPAFLARQVGAQCRGGLLHVTRAKSEIFRSTGSWADRRKVAPYNLFYADIEADARARAARLTGR